MDIYNIYLDREMISYARELREVFTEEIDDVNTVKYTFDFYLVRYKREKAEELYNKNQKDKQGYIDLSEEIKK